MTIEINTPQRFYCYHDKKQIADGWLAECFLRFQGLTVSEKVNVVQLYTVDSSVSVYLERGMTALYHVKKCVDWPLLFIPITTKLHVAWVCECFSQLAVVGRIGCWVIRLVQSMNHSGGPCSDEISATSLQYELPTCWGNIWMLSRVVLCAVSDTYTVVSFGSSPSMGNVCYRNENTPIGKLDTRTHRHTQPLPSTTKGSPLHLSSKGCSGAIIGYAQSPLSVCPAHSQSPQQRNRYVQRGGLCIWNGVCILR